MNTSFFRTRVVPTILTVALMVLLGGAFAFAQGGGGAISPADLPPVIGGATGGEGSFRSLALNIVNFFLYFLGFIAVVMIIYGGILYVTSAGNQENVDKAKKILLYAIIGVVVILLSFAIVNTILTGAGTSNQAAT